MSSGEINVEIETGSSDGPTVVNRVKNVINPANHSIVEIVLACLLFVFILSTIILAALISRPPPQPEAVCSSRLCFYNAASTLAAMNQSINPCENFFKHVCGNFPLFYPLAPNEGEKRVATLVRENNIDKVENILVGGIVDSSKDSYERKVKRVFTNCINEYQTEKLKGTFLVLELIDKWWLFNPENLKTAKLNPMLAVGHIQFWQPVFFDWLVRENFMDKGNNALEIHAGCLGMSAIYYYSTREGLDKIRQAYRDYMKTIAEFLVRDSQLPIDNPADNIDIFVQDVWNLESRIANVTFSAEGPDPNVPPHLPENQVSIADMQGLYTNIDWLKLFQDAFTPAILDRNTKIVLYQKDYIRLINEMINGLRRDYAQDWERMINNYIVWRIVQPHTQDLSSDYIHAERLFFETRVGRKEFASQYDYCFRLTQQMMPKALGALFVADHFSDSSKSEIDTMYTNLRTVTKEAVQQMTWMDADTRTKAVMKLDNLLDKIGYPTNEVTKEYLNNEYKNFNVTDGDGSHLLVKLDYYKYRMVQTRELLSKPVNRNQWYGRLYDVTVYLYNPWIELIVPAGVLQWPYFTAGMPGFHNYGAIGTYIATELIKAIDASGQYYDENGSRNEWWSEATKQKYANQKQCSKNYFANPNLIAGPWNYNGKPYTRPLSQIYNIASRERAFLAAQGGLEVTYNTYKRFIGSELKLPQLPMSADQTFFVSFAQNFCFARTDSYSYNRFIVRLNWPEEYYVNHIVAHSPGFSQAFNCPAGSNMNAQSKCKVY